MPFVGKQQSDEIVLPWEVPDGAVVKCPDCDAEMEVRESYYNQGKKISRHFVHRQGTRPDDCSGGESRKHELMKAYAARRLDEVFPSATVTLEKKLHERRIADVVALFDDGVLPYGNGIVIEAQYRNKGKNTGLTTQDFLSVGYTVVWAYESDYDFKNASFQIPTDRTITTWPNAVPDVGGRSLYPDCTPTRLPGEQPPTTQTAEKIVPATIPPGVKRIHQLDIARPLDRGDSGWEKHAKQPIHSVGNDRTYFHLYGHQEVGSFLEFYTVDKNNPEETRDWMAIPIAPDDKQAVMEFCEQSRQHLPPEKGVNETDSWLPLESVTLTANAQLRGQIAFGVSATGSYEIQVRQWSSVGVFQSRSLNYRHGDLDRLEGIEPTFSALYCPARPYQTDGRLLESSQCSESGSHSPFR